MGSDCTGFSRCGQHFLTPLGFSAAVTIGTYSYYNFFRPTAQVVFCSASAPAGRKGTEGRVCAFVSFVVCSMRNTTMVVVLVLLAGMASVCEGAPPKGCECLSATKIQVQNESCNYSVHRT